jgi:hypothetical protein
VQLVDPAIFAEEGFELLDRHVPNTWHIFPYGA